MESSGEREYLEERLTVLRGLGPDGIYDTRTRADINACVDRLDSLVALGEDLIALLARATADAGLASLRDWLLRDLDRQRALLADFHAQGFRGTPH